MLSRASLLLALLAAFSLAAPAAEPKKAAPKPPPEPKLDRPTEAELDKPGEPAVPTPQALPPTPKKDGQGGEPETVNPFGKRGEKPSYAVPCRITFSDGTILEGFTWRRANDTLRVFNRAKRAHQDYALANLRRISVRSESETFEQDWRWKNQGSSEKVFLDTGYLWHQCETTLVPKDGEPAVGDCSGQFYLLTLDGKSTKWFLYKRYSGRDLPHKKREEFPPIVFVKTVEFTDDILKPKPDAKAPPDAKSQPPAEDAPAAKEAPKEPAAK